MRTLFFVSSWPARSALLLLAAVAACTEPVERTQVTVLIDADHSVRSLIRSVDVEVRSGPPDADLWDVTWERQLVPRNGEKSWPLRFSLGRPKGSGPVGYLVTATAKGADDETLSIVRALSDYAEGKSVELRLNFDESCMKRTALCASTFSCRQGECIDPFIPVSELPTTTGSGEDRPAQMTDTTSAGASGEPVAGPSAPQGAAGMTATAAGCQGSGCPSTTCAARDAKGTCLPCLPGFIGDDAMSCSPALISLTGSVGTLAPALDLKTTDYTLDVGLLAERVTLKLEAPPGAEVRIDDRSLEGKTTWTSPALAFGDTKVAITLMASGSVTRSYTLTLKRNGEQQAFVPSPFPGAGDAFGTSLAISGDLVLAGAPYEDGSESKPAGEPDEGAKDSGAAYLFERTATGWMNRAYLKAETPRAGAHFAFNVTIDGTRFAVGVPGDADGGSVYVYEYGADGVEQVVVLHGDSSDGEFGRTLMLRGDRLVIGSPGDSVGASQAGSVYVFDHDGTTWQRKMVLRSETPGTWDWLGSSIAFDGDIIASGATGRTVAGQMIPSGVAYVFEHTKDGWKQAAMLSPTKVVSGAFFGEHLSVLGGTLAVGGFFGSAGLSPGSAYVFTRGSDGKWTQEQELQAKNARGTDYFGDRVLLLSSELLMVGAAHESSAMGGIGADGSGKLDDSGVVYLFSRSAGSWRQSIAIKLSEPMMAQEFGIGLGASNGTWVAGAPADPKRDGSSNQPGGFYVFR